VSRRTKKAPPVGRWAAEAGLYPFKVVVEENPHRQGALYLRWWNAEIENWKRESLQSKKLGKQLRTAGDEIDPAVATWAVEQAMRKSQQLSGTLIAGSIAAAKRLTVGEIEDLITDPESGQYPHASPFRDELVRALRFGVTIWGKDTPIDTLDESSWTKLIRARVTDLVNRGFVGTRMTEITVSRLITALTWLRKRKKIPAGAAEIDEKWKEDLKSFRRGLTGSKRDPEPQRPRHTQEEMIKLLEAAPKVDPRMSILLYVTAELRLGQTSRAMRSDLKLEAAEFGELHIFGAGHKGGEIVELTEGMRQLVDAYLSGFLKPLEDRWLSDSEDYPLFPAGRLLGRKAGENLRFGKKMRTADYVSRQWIRKTFHAVERKAGVAVVKGRGPYGLRRMPVDEALTAKVSEQALKALGGWSSTVVPKGVYAEQGNRVGRREARDFKAKLRGEMDKKAPPPIEAEEVRDAG
jgi:hypothetical protein